MNAPIVVYDACVLFSAQLRDLLMRLALADLCAARWSDEILDEWSRSVTEKHENVTAQSVARCRELMNRHIGEALVIGYESLVPTLELPDPDDRHVLAAAIHAQAKAIITFNLKDFPESSLSPLGIEAIHPDDFLLRLLQSEPSTVCAVIREQRAQLTKPAVDAEAFLARLERQGLPQACAILRTMSSSRS
jgi:predicted nucleic acid-binding protein